MSCQFVKCKTEQRNTGNSKIHGFGGTPIKKIIAEGMQKVLEAFREYADEKG